MILLQNIILIMFFELIYLLIGNLLIYHFYHDKNLPKYSSNPIQKPYIDIDKKIIYINKDLYDNDYNTLLMLKKEGFSLKFNQSKINLRKDDQVVRFKDNKLNMWVAKNFSNMKYIEKNVLTDSLF